MTWPRWRRLRWRLRRASEVCTTLVMERPRDLGGVGAGPAGSRRALVDYWLERTVVIASFSVSMVAESAPLKMASRYILIHGL